MTVPIYLAQKTTSKTKKNSSLSQTFPPKVGDGRPVITKYNCRSIFSSLLVEVEGGDGEMRRKKGKSVVKEVCGE
jgi:hypothetical protein